MDSHYEKEFSAGTTLFRFNNKRIESEYLFFQSEQCRSATRQLLLVGMLMLVIASAVDIWFASSEFAKAALFVRASWMIPPMVLAYSVWYFRFGHLVRQLAGMFVGLAVAIGSLYIANVAITTGEPIAPGGYLVIMVYTFFFLGLRYDLAILTSVAIVTSAVVFAISSGAQHQTIATNMYNTISMLVACAIGAGQLESVRRRDFLISRITFHKAHVDALTGLPNRRALDLHMRNTWSEGSEQFACAAVYLADIDYFKDYNDRYGHQAGDTAIQKVADALRRSLYRPQDFVGRYGGEEFAVIAPAVDRQSALRIAERLRSEVYRLNIPHKRQDEESRLTISVGVVIHKLKGSQRSMEGVLQAADEALYAAKVAGRNRVVEASQLVEESGTGVFSVAQYEQQTV